MLYKHMYSGKGHQKIIPLKKAFGRMFYLTVIMSVRSNSETFLKNLEQQTFARGGRPEVYYQKIMRWKGSRLVLLLTNNRLISFFYSLQDSSFSFNFIRVLCSNTEILSRVPTFSRYLLLQRSLYQMCPEVLDTPLKWIQTLRVIRNLKVSTILWKYVFYFSNQF